MRIRVEFVGGKSLTGTVDQWVAEAFTSWLTHEDNEPQPRGPVWFRLFDEAAHQTRLVNLDHAETITELPE